MNSSNDNKRMIAEDDRLSSLPDELIHKILSFISIKHVVQMSVLSSRWRFIWTSMPYLNFSRDDFSRPHVWKLIKYVFSGRNNQTKLSSVNLSFHGENSDFYVEQIIKYACSHNIQQLNVACLLENDNVEFPRFLFSSPSLKHLSLTKENYSHYRPRTSLSFIFKPTATLELPALTTLYLHNVTFCCDENTDKCIDFFSKFANLKNLTLKSCTMKGFNALSIRLPLLANLTLENIYESGMILDIVAPQLKNLTITSSYKQNHYYQISAPDLTFLLYKGSFCLQLSTEDFLSLEKADICVSIPTDAHRIIRLLQQLHNVKRLTLSLELVEFLSSCTKLMSHQPSPFANLKSLKIHPASELLEMREDEGVPMSAKVKSYLLDSSPGATFTLVTREDVRAMKNTKKTENLITELWVLLEQEKASTETKIEKMHELPKPQVDKHIDRYIHWYFERCWKCMSLEIEKEKEKASNIISKLKEIKDLLGELPASNRAIIQPFFSTLCAEADIVMKKITDLVKINCDENQRHLSACFHELATKLQPSS